MRQSLTDLEFSACVQDRHARAGTRAGRRAIRAARCYYAGIPGDETILFAADRSGELNDRHATNFWQFGMGNRHLLARGKAYLLAEISQRTSLTRFELEAQFLSVDNREYHAAISNIDLQLTDPMDIDLDVQLQRNRRHVLDGDALTFASSARRGDLHASRRHIERELSQRLLHGDEARFEQDGRDAHRIGA